jgi:pseudouridine synthase
MIFTRWQQIPFLLLIAVVIPLCSCFHPADPAVRSLGSSSSSVDVSPRRTTLHDDDKGGGKQQKHHHHIHGPRGVRRNHPITTIPEITTLEDERTVVLLYNKPPGSVTSHVSQDSRPTVYEEIRSMRGFLGGDVVVEADAAAATKNDDDGQRNATTPTTKTIQCGGGGGGGGNEPTTTSTFTTPTTTTTTFEGVTGIRSKLHAVGRLDADTSGLLLLTNDGGLVHHVTNPNAESLFLLQQQQQVDPRRQHNDGSNDKRTGARTPGAGITKTYEAWIMGHHTDESLSAVRNGIDIGTKHGGWTEPVSDLTIVRHPNHKSTVVSITIREGRNRQIRRMFHAAGSGVMKLKRTRVGDDLTLRGVTEEGQWRILSDEEVREALHWEPRRIPPQQQQRQRPSIRGKKEMPSSRDGGRQRRRMSTKCTILK